MMMMMKSVIAIVTVIPFLLVARTGAFQPPLSKNGPTSRNPLSMAETTTGTTRKTRAPVFDEVCDTTGVTLKRFMSEVAMLNPELDEIKVLFGAIETACKAITNLVKRSQLPSSETLGFQGNINVQGEQQKKLDVITNNLLKRALRFTGRLGVLASEEEDAPVSIPGAPYSAGATKDVLIDAGTRYCAVFDPLDGSSNVDAGIPTGTIIGIYEFDETCEIDFSSLGSEDSEDQEALCLANTLQPGNNLVAAAYCLYSSSTFLVLTLGAGTFGFTLDENLGEFVLSHPNIKIPEESAIYSFNEANFNYWDEPLKATVRNWKAGTGASGKQFSSRYIGSMVGDVHRTLMYGGVFGYPGDEKNPNGKLRLVYEGAPMSFIVEQAGGISTTGTERVMDLIPELVHERTPVFMGSRNDVQEIIDGYAAWQQ
ncbi:Fructose-1,6-bisphosphatase class 1 [Seminavis robusta]|uniref:fructose-bisphosphatase n=1 Tax=Seminavis robusta TaxID=568900 RepID=A0A9N8EIC4_9STRA|nr:Fructose-1,6-bisphosphatase class 1 [Seminavis robusta]|eukprot:Sro1215_g253170.1 Fructose-1,6-bisphosphatase class 1 (426) ;mRNA; r:13654-15069